VCVRDCPRPYVCVRECVGPKASGTAKSERTLCALACVMARGRCVCDSGTHAARECVWLATADGSPPQAIAARAATHSRVREGHHDLCRDGVKKENSLGILLRPPTHAVV